MTQGSRSGLIMLFRRSLGTYQRNELTGNSSGNTQPQSSQLAKPLWTDSGFKKKEKKKRVAELVCVSWSLLSKKPPRCRRDWFIRRNFFFLIFPQNRMRGESHHHSHHLFMVMFCCLGFCFSWHTQVIVGEKSKLPNLLSFRPNFPRIRNTHATLLTIFPVRLKRMGYRTLSFSDAKGKVDSVSVQQQLYVTQVVV